MGSGGNGEREGQEQPCVPLPTAPRAPGPSYRAELGLQVDLQALDGAAQLRDLRLATLKLLRVDGHLPVQLFRLHQGTTRVVPLEHR